MHTLARLPRPDRFQFELFGESLPLHHRTPPGGYCPLFEVSTKVGLAQPDPSLTTLRQVVGGDLPRFIHDYGTGRARGRIAVAPADEDGEEVRRCRKGHHRAAIVRGRAGRPAVRSEERRVGKEWSSGRGG